MCREITASRRTEVGFDAVHHGANGRTTEKPQRPMGCRAYLALNEAAPCAALERSVTCHVVASLPNREPIYELRSTQRSAARQFHIRTSSPRKVEARALCDHQCGLGINTGIGEDLRNHDAQPRLNKARVPKMPSKREFLLVKRPKRAEQLLGWLRAI
jgi:hypothetical protein